MSIEHHSHHHSRKIGRRALRGAIFVTAGFMVVEYIGGWFSNSLALMSDATHMLTDVGALSISLLAFWLADRPSNPKMSFGYHRAEILGALLNGLLIWMICGVLIYEGVERIANPQSVKGQWVLLIAIGGLMVNFVALRILHPSKQESGENLNLRAAYLHVWSDIAGSLAAILAGAVIWFTGWTLIDPLLSFLVAGLVLLSSWKLISESLGVLMESVPKGIDARNVEMELAALPSVEGVHDLHIWAVTSGKPALSVHLLGRDSEKALRQAQELLRSRFHISHTTIQVEHPEGDAQADCGDCGTP